MLIQGPRDESERAEFHTLLKLCQSKDDATKKQASDTVKKLPKDKHGRFMQYARGIQALQKQEKEFKKQEDYHTKEAEKLSNQQRVLLVRMQQIKAQEKQVDQDLAGLKQEQNVMLGRRPALKPVGVR